MLYLETQHNCIGNDLKTIDGKLNNYASWKLLVVSYG